MARTVDISSRSVLRRRDVRNGGAGRLPRGMPRYYLRLGSWTGRVSGASLPSERCVRAAVGVGEIRLEDDPQVGFAEDDDVVEAVAANGAHEALHEWILRMLAGDLGPATSNVRRGESRGDASGGLYRDGR